MAGRVFGLLIGIDAYEPPVPRLHGCVNDVTAIETLLSTRLGAPWTSRLLANADATRAGVEEAFASHLGAAGPDDDVLIYYSGHGSQQPVPDGEWTVEADRLQETLVLFDSRGAGGRDLADVEFGALVASVADRGARVLVVLDCCHSGSGTRTILDSEVLERSAPTDERPRSSVSYQPVREAAQELSRHPGGRPPHILLAACRSNETAKELKIGGQARGVLSAALEEVLSDGYEPTYRELHRFVGVKARQRVRAQNPQLETTASGDLERPFLGGTVPGVASSAVLAHDATTGWWIDLGAVHGIPATAGAEATQLTVFDGQPRESDVVAEATVAQVEPQRSRLTIEPPDALDVGRTYRAVVSAWPVPALRVAAEGDPDRVEALRVAATGEPGSERAQLVQLVDDDPQFVVTTTASGYRIRRPGSPRALFADIEPGDADEDEPNAAERAALALEHLARWTQIAGLRNPTSTLTAMVAVTITLDPPQQDAAGGLRARYRLDDGGNEIPPAVTITLTNKDPGRTLWFSVVDLPATYGAFPGVIGDPGSDGQVTGVTAVEPGSERSFTVEGELPDALLAEGVHEVDDLLKVIVSTEEFDPRSLELPDLSVSGPARVERGGLADPRSSLERLFQRSVTRRIRRRPSAGEARADWTTVDVMLTIERSPGRVALPSGRDPVELAPGVTMLAHSGLRGTAWLEAGETATREIERPPLPALLLDNPDDVEPFALVSTRGDVATIDTLTIADPIAPETVTEDDPLRLRLDVTLADDEHLLPVAWDGEFYLPLGWATSDEHGTDVVLERLPSAALADSRSLGGSIRILFRKLVGRRLGREYAYPLLRLATTDDAGTLRYEADSDVMRSTVASASRVLLYVHGIIGDTKGMALSAGRTSLDPAPELIGGRYDCVLTFDYENLDTRIAENARLLGERLVDAGLGPDDGKHLDLVAHSMGGLVSRHYIEFGGGAAVVDRLVTLGTPCAGSPWPTFQKRASALAAAALNGLTAIPWPLSVLAGLLAVVEKVDNALDEMEPDSPFLRALEDGPDPGIPYTVLVGTRSFAAPIAADGGPLRRLLRRLSPRAAAAAVLEALFMGEVNDVAVSAASARNLPTDRSPAVVVHEVASDHMTYFQNEEALAVLAAALPSAPDPAPTGGEPA